jgi:hypothetical protein
VQLLIRILINQQCKFQIEKDPRVAKYDYGSRPHYSIDNMILEKRIIYDNSMLNSRDTIYNMTDLKLYYDKKLAEIGSIVQESIGIERLLIKLFIKLLPVIQYNICTSYGASQGSYGG